MKVCTNEIMLMGGMYQILAFIFASFNSEITTAMGGILYILFWCAVIAVSLALMPSWKIVHKMNESFPRMSVFVASIGWIPYFSVLYAGLSFSMDYLYNRTDMVATYMDKYMSLYDVYYTAICLSLLYAAYKVFYKREDLVMDCPIKMAR